MFIPTVDHWIHAKTTCEGFKPSRAIKPQAQGHQALDTWREHTKRPLTMWNDFGTSFTRLQNRILNVKQMPDFHITKKLVNYHYKCLDCLSTRTQGFGAPEFLMGLVPIKSYLGDI
ncbi:hypothetical protein EDD16DRAFT_1517011 [Pisolithus croceorrhizus]|nr:hypothetical protein EV401DRAFT_1891506 [Pisolithus croceorrhizus]KAI6125880.1 hypothetical protein EDD16DRAFT_1517011 [Pisolithus croceorrhizus]